VAQELDIVVVLLLHMYQTAEQLVVQLVLVVQVMDSMHHFSLKNKKLNFKIIFLSLVVEIQLLIVVR